MSSADGPARKAHVAAGAAWEKGIEALGCKEQFDAMQECSLELNDWRKCSDQVKAFEKCMKEQGGRVVGTAAQRKK